MKLRAQIISVVLVPIIGLGIVSALGVQTSLETLEQTEKAERSVDLALPLTDLIHQLQVERGLSAGHIASGGQNFQLELPTQRKVVDAAIAVYRQTESEIATSNPSAVSELDDLLGQLDRNRQGVSGLTLTVPEMARFFTASVRTAIELNAQIYANFSKVELLRAGAGMVQVSEAKEAAGLERAMGATGFGAGAFSPIILRRFGEFGRLQSSELKQAQLYSELLESAQQFEAGPEYDAIQRLRGVVFASEGQDLKGITAPEWFQTSTAWVEYLRQVELRFGEAVKREAHNLTVAASRDVWVYAGLAVFALLASMLGGLVLTQRFGRRIDGLSASMAQIATKDFDTKISHLAEKSEIGDLSRSLDKMRSQLKNAENAQLEIAYKSAAFEVAGAPLIMTDLDFNIRMMNSAFVRMARTRADDFRASIPDFDPDALMGKNMDNFHAIPEKARARLSDPKNLPIKTKLSVGNAYIGLLVDAIHDHEGEKIGYVVDWKDQTDQMHNQVLMEAIDSGQGRVEIAIDGSLQNANATFAEMLGAAPEDLQGMDMKACLSLETGDTSGSDFWQDVENGNSTFARFHLRGTERDVIIDGSLGPIPNHKGETTGFLLLGTDVTDERRAKLAAEERQQKMSEAQTSVVSAFETSLLRLSDGDLTATIDFEFAEDYEQLRSNYNDAVSSLRNALADVLDATASIQEHSAEVRSASDDLSKRTERQAATLEETSAALNQLTVSVKSASDGASQASNVVEEARKNAENSGSVVRDAVDAMAEIENSSKAISNIISVIDDIAFQTNLLALNAGVEAARAGDAGRGFAVVASEVRGLAQRSSDAAREINELITSSGEQVQRGATLVNQAGTALNEIVASVSDIATHVSAIANSANEQSTGLSEINEAIAELDRATQHNTAMVEESTATSQNLQSQADLLSTTTSRFLTEPASGLSTSEMDGTWQEAS